MASKTVFRRPVPALVIAVAMSVTSTRSPGGKATASASAEVLTRPITDVEAVVRLRTPSVASTLRTPWL